MNLKTTKDQRKEWRENGQITVPYFYHDLCHDADLAEELLREPCGTEQNWLEVVRKDDQQAIAWFRIMIDESECRKAAEQENIELREKLAEISKRYRWCRDTGNSAIRSIRKQIGSAATALNADDYIDRAIAQEGEE